MSLPAPLLRLTPAVFVLLWSTGFIGAKLGAPHAEPFTFLLVRFAIVTGLLAAIAGFARTRWPAGRAIFDSIVAGALIHGIYLGAVFWAIDRGMPAGVNALVIGLQPLATAFIAAPLLGETITPRHWLGLVIGLFGAVLVLYPKLDVAGAGINAATVGVTLIGMLAITLGTIYQKRFATGVPLFTGGVYQYIGGTLTVALGAVLFERFEIDWTPEFIFALSWLILVLSIGAISLLMILIREGAVSKVATLIYLVPAVAALIAYFLFGETLTPIQLVGMAVTMAAVAIANR